VRRFFVVVSSRGIASSMIPTERAIRWARSLLVATACAASVVGWSRTVRAETLAAPIGGRAIALGADRVGCKDSLTSPGWTLEPDGHGVKPPARDDAAGTTVALRVAPNEAACATSTTTVALLSLGAKPTAEANGVAVEIDAGRVVVRGHHLRGSLLAWSAGGRRGVDMCAAPDPAIAGVESCAFAIPRDLPADPTSIELALMPAGAPRVPDATLFDAAGRRTPPDEYVLRASQIVIARLFAPDASIDVSSGTARLALAHADAIASVDCTDATCDVDGQQLLVRGEHGADNNLDVHFQLRPRVVLRDGAAAPESAPVRAVSLQRCPVSLASPPPFVGAGDQRVVLRIGGTCALSDGDLDAATPSGVATIERTLLVGAERYAVVHVGKVDAEAFTIRVRRRGTVIGVASASARRIAAIHARLEIPGRGPIDFIPTNRWVKVTLPPSPDGGTLVPIAIEGAYDVRKDDKATWIRGAEGATGGAFLRFAFVDASLPESLRDVRLAEVSEPVDRMLRVANVPIALGALARDKQPIVELVCGDGDGHAHAVVAGVTASIPFRARDTCHLVIHRERLHDEDGAQAFQVSVQVTASDGIARAEARVEKRLVLKRAASPTYVAIAGTLRPFDRILVRVALAADETHYAAFSAEQGAPEAQWSVVTGDDHFRIYGTAAIPTGLFRVADTGHSGILTLSVGAILRGVVLSRDGTEFPIGLEAGVMWLGVAGDTDPSASSRGAVAVVFGPGISIPIANVSRSTQTSISLHAWLEYEVSRAVLGQSGQAVGFVFGPSITIGDVGTNF
jgi:hypothetical protein